MREREREEDRAIGQNVEKGRKYEYVGLEYTLILRIFGSLSGFSLFSLDWHAIELFQAGENLQHVDPP